MTPSVVLITGASRGIGRAAADCLTARGHQVFGTSRAPEKDSSSAFPLLPLDVRDDSSVAACVAAVLERAGRIDVLINNAGIAIGGAVEEASMDDVRRLFETNFFGVVRVTNAVLPHMRARRSGRILNISSLAGLIGIPYLGIYAASKHALTGYTASLRLEVRRFNIHVSLIEPGDIRTDIQFDLPSALLPDYDGIRERVTHIHESAVRDGPPADPVAEAILRAVTDRSPRLHYRIMHRREWFVPLMLRLLPDSLSEWMLRFHYRLDG